jgi:four helix bundle protein
MQPAKNFTDLKAWQASHEVALATYMLVRAYPDEEKLSLSSQMRRAVVSVTSNIAEGFGRQSTKEKSQFYAIASGSLTELQNQLILSRDIGLVSKSDFNNLWAKSVTALKLIHGLRKANKLKE